MEPESIKEILIRRDSMTEAEATMLIEEATAELFYKLELGLSVDDADFMRDWFGLEPDYIIELLDGEVSNIDFSDKVEV